MSRYNKTSGPGMIIGDRPPSWVCSYPLTISWDKYTDWYVRCNSVTRSKHGRHRLGTHTARAGASGRTGTARSRVLCCRQFGRPYV